LLDNRIFRLLMAPTRAGLRVASAAVQAFLKTVARVVGSEVINDIDAFFRAFEGMEDGFRERAQAVGRLLADPDTAFVLITSPRRDALEEATFFAEKLGDSGQTVQALIVNRVHPSFGDEAPGGLRAAADALRDDGSEPALRLAALYDNLADFRQVAALERSHLDELRSTVGDDAVVAFGPYRAHDVYDFAALAEIGGLLFAPDTVPVQ
jgi:anion-transporting  ArsA/GET3 family ATPase